MKDTNKNYTISKEQPLLKVKLEVFDAKNTSICFLLKMQKTQDLIFKFANP